MVECARRSLVAPNSACGSPGADVTGRACSRNAPEHSPGRQTGSSAVVVVVEAADDLAGRKQTANGRPRWVQHFGMSRNLQAPEGEGDADRDPISLIGRRIQAVGPIGLVDGETRSSQSIVDARIKRAIGARRSVVFGNR